jgi:hypothetical protein
MGSHFEKNGSAMERKRPIHYFSLLFHPVLFRSAAAPFRQVQLLNAAVSAGIFDCLPGMVRTLSDPV